MDLDSIDPAFQQFAHQNFSFAASIMARKSHVEVVQQGKAVLAKWRQANPDELLDLSDAKLCDVNLRGANLKRAELTGADLRGADLVGTMFAEADLTRADLRGAKLVKADFYMAKLFRATLAESDCSGAYFRRAEMSQCDLSSVDLTKADLVEANLPNSLLKDAVLIGADLTRAVLHDADVRGVTLGWTTLGSLDLSRVFGLDQCKHIGPSVLSLDTARRSYEKLDENFLRSCGVSEGVLQHWKSLFGHPAERVSCFIRFAPDDASFAEPLFAAAQAKGLRCWLDEMSASATVKRGHLTSTAYESDERVLLCVSKSSLTSPWINDELERIFEREKRLKSETGRDVRLLYPLNLDGFLFSGSWKHKHEKIMAKLAVDFVGWRRNNAKLDQEVTKLLALLLTEKR